MREKAISSMTRNRSVIRALNALNTNWRKIGRVRDQIVEGVARDGHGFDWRLGDTLALIMVVPHEAGRRERAALPGGDAVKDDFAPALGDLLDADGAVEQKQEIRWGLAGAEDARPLGQGHDPALRLQGACAPAQAAC